MTYWVRFVNLPGYLADSYSSALNALWPIWPKFVSKLQKCIFCDDLTFLHTNGLEKHQKSQKNWKRPTKVIKVNLKARELKIWKFNDFSSYWGPFGVNYYGNLVFWSFKVVKAKKATTVARNANSHIWMSNCPKLLSLHPYAIIILPKGPIWLGKLHTVLLRAKL